jgi:hypothetical protein
MARTSIFRSPIFWGGVGVLAAGVGVVLHQRRNELLGRGRGPRAAGPTPVLITRNPAKMPTASETRHIDGRTVKRFDMKSMSIDERLKLIQAQTWDGVQDPRIRKLAFQITAGCGRDDGDCEARRIFDAVKAKVRYTGDVGPVINPATGKVEGMDYYQKPWVTWEYGGGDCDDAVALVSSLMAVIGHTVRLRVSAPSRLADWAHIYPVSILPKDNPRTPKAVDITLPWKAQVGSEAKYGKARDYLIEAPA